MWHKYINGNYTVFIDDESGSKIRVQYDDSKDFVAEFPESLDINLTQRCDGGCAFCYANCHPDGKHGEILSQKFLETIRPYTEVALQVNDMSHPQLVPFLKMLKERKAFANMTVNQIHFERKLNLIQELIDKRLIYGLGVSLRNPTLEFIVKAKQIPNLVIHTINGVHGREDFEALRGNNLKVLILGYKDKGRGHDYLKTYADAVSQNMKWLKENLDSIVNDNWNRLVSFDNLALEQLNVKSIVTDEQWEQFYLGDDGQYTFYIDLVDGTFGKSSLMPKSEMMPLRNDVAEMLQIIKEKYK